MGSFQSPITIYHALEYIKGGYYILPAFQREFVWEAEQIERLFDSLLQDYPIGSMLFWRVRGNALNSFRFYSFINSYTEDFHTMDSAIQTAREGSYAVLDGQQRLTALYLGLYGSFASHEPRKKRENNENSYPTRHLYFCISRESNQEDKDRRYIFKFEKDIVTNSVNLYIDQNGDTWFRVGYLVQLHFGDYNLDDFLDEYVDDRNRKKRLRKLNDSIFTDLTINFYEEDTESADVAVNIFTRINSGGTHLEQYDILFAVLVANWTRINAKEEFDSLIKGINNKGFSIKVDYILRAILFLFSKTVKYSLNVFSSEFCSRMEDNWSHIRDSINSLFDLLRSFGLDSSTLTSNNATLPILYYLYHKGIYDNYTTAVAYEGERKIIKKWLLSVILRKAFSSQSDAVLNDARKAFTDNIENRYFDIEFEEFPSTAILEKIKNRLDSVDEESIVELLSTPKDNKYCFSILAILYPNMDYRNNNFHKDHLHPMDSYKNLSDDNKRKYSQNMFNSIVNLQMLDANENESKSNKPLEQWVSEEVGKGYERGRFLENHLIPDINLSLDNFDEFYQRRKEMLTAKLRELLS